MYFNAGEYDCFIFHGLQLMISRPIASYWAPFEYNTFRCIDRKALTIATQDVNSASDFLIFLWPARTLSRVRLPRMQRFGLIFVFSIGVVYVSSSFLPFCLC